MPKKLLHKCKTCGLETTNPDCVFCKHVKLANKALKKYLSKFPKRVNRLKLEIVAGYGGRCSCCGEMEPIFLQIDHIYNDGHIQREAGEPKAHDLYRHLKDRGFPREQHQLLCANCNIGKFRNAGICPHQLYGNEKASICRFCSKQESLAWRNYGLCVTCYALRARAEISHRFRCTRCYQPVAKFGDPICQKCISAGAVKYSTREEEIVALMRLIQDPEIKKF